MAPSSRAAVAELPVIFFLAQGGKSALVAAELVERLRNIARVQVVTDINDVPAEFREQSDAFPRLPDEVFELMPQWPMECPELGTLERPATPAGYGPPRRGRKGKPLRW